MRYVSAKKREQFKREAYRIYVSDSLYYSRTEQRLAKRYIEVVEPKPEDTRTGDEIAADIIAKLKE